MDINYTPLQYPSLSGSNPLAEALMKFKENRQRAATNLLAQKKLEFEVQRESERANREAEHARTEKIGAVMQYLDPSSPQFNPAMAGTMAKLHGLNLTQSEP